MGIQSDLVFTEQTCRPTINNNNDNDDPRAEIIPVINLADPQAKILIVKSCEQVGFFKVINHGIPLELIAALESEAIQFFRLPQADKDAAGPPYPFGYGSKNIGPNGDIGWVEYLLLNPNAGEQCHQALEKSLLFRRSVEEYVARVKKMTSEVLELIAEGLGLGIDKSVLSRIVGDEQSDCCFRINHYPQCQDMEAAPLSGRNLVGFGEHTDPQLISVLRSNNTTGLHICLRDGNWVPVPPDHSSFFINVGDSLQVLTNGRFNSVKHKVVADPAKSRCSMIYFAGPALNEKIAPLEALLKEGEESQYEEFTWADYKKSAYKSKLADNRLALFEKGQKLPTTTLESTNHHTTISRSLKI